MVAPDALEGCKPFLYRLPLDNVDIPFNDVFRFSAGSRQRCLDVFQNLFGLCLEVPFSDDCSRWIYSILSTDIDCLYGTCYRDDICERRVFWVSRRD